jgi:hypothetical protein
VIRPVASAGEAQAACQIRKPPDLAESLDGTAGEVGKLCRAAAFFAGPIQDRKGRSGKSRLR